MITFSAGGRLGNQMFQYSFARIMAEWLGFKLSTDFCFSDTVTTTPHLDGECYTNNTEKIVENINTGNMFDREYQRRHYHFEGYWQDAGYYVPRRNQVLGFFNEKAPTELNKNDIVMHVRLGDYKKFGQGGTVLDPKYYLDCLGREEWDTLYIVTDSPNDSYFKEFRKYKHECVHVSEKDDFWFLTKFNRIVTGNSTFSWWAAFMSNAEVIYTPGCWVRNIVGNKSNLKFIDNGIDSGIIMPAGFLNK